MSVGALEILERNGADAAILGLDRATREALVIYCARRWHAGRRKAVEREWGLSPDEARGIIEGTASWTTVDKVWKKGGWAVVLPILGAVIGHGVGEYFAEEARRAREDAEEATGYAAAADSAARVAFRGLGPRLAAGLDMGLDRLAWSQAEGVGGGPAEAAANAAPLTEHDQTRRREPRR